MELLIQTPRWALPLLEPARYKGAFGGRGSGKSHLFAENLVEACFLNKDHENMNIIIAIIATGSNLYQSGCCWKRMIF